MSDKTLDLEKATAAGPGITWMREVISCLAGALIVGLFVWATDSTAPLDSTSPHAQDSYYNLLVQGFSEGHLYVKRDPPAALMRLANPYDAVANAPYIRPVIDLSYYKGKLYLYFGVTPALVLFWPWHALTGQYLSEGGAVAILFAIGFAAALGLARAICRRYFPETNIWMLTACMLVLGLAMGLTISGTVCQQSGLAVAGSVYDIAATCGFAFAMLALAGIWKAMHKSSARQALWLALASLAYGLAVGSRPTLLFGAVVLLVPVFQAWRALTDSEPCSRVIVLIAAAAVPITLVGFGLMLYNDLRFGNPLEFGWRFQLNRGYQAAARQFSLHYLWYDFWFYFLQPFGLTAHFPFLKSIPLPPLPSGHYETRTATTCGGILTNYPLALLALAVPLAWKGRPAQTVSSLRWFAVALFCLFTIVSSTLCLFFATIGRYELDFLPELLLLSVIGFLCLDRVLTSRREASLVRWGWGLLLTYSLIFSLLLNIEAHAKVDSGEGNILLRNNRFDDALAKFQKAGAIWPDYADAHYGLANTFEELGRQDAAIAEYQKALEIAPDYALAHEHLGYCYLKAGNPDDALAQCQKAVDLEPDSGELRSSLAFCLFQMGRTEDAIVQCRKAVELEPASAAYHTVLGTALDAKGLSDEAIAQYEKAIELQPNAVQAYDNLGNDFLRQGQTAKAIQQWKLALKYMPNMASALVNLSWVLATCPDASLRDAQTAIALAGRANRLFQGRNPAALRSLAAAFAENGQYADAVTAAQQALQMSRGNPGLAATIQEQLKYYQNRQPYRDQTPGKSQ